MIHVPVLLHETVDGLALRPDAWVIDGTLGAGGHSEAILEATGPNGRLLGIDKDKEAIIRARQRLARFGERVTLRQGSFGELGAIAHELGLSGVQGVMLDLGISSDQLDAADRGFSFQVEGPLDMRMDVSHPLTAGEIVNQWSQEQIADLIYEYAEEPRSRRIARAIVAARPLRTTTELAEVVAQALGGRKGQRIHPATQVFQALRIAVNDELGALKSALPQIVSLLAPGGRVAIIAFHSLEDRLVKRFFQQEARDCICDTFPGYTSSRVPQPCRCGHLATLRIVTRRPIQPGEGEIARNARSRSAKLRIAERLPAR